MGQLMSESSKHPRARQSFWSVGSQQLKRYVKAEYVDETNAELLHKVCKSLVTKVFIPVRLKSGQEPCLPTAGISNRIHGGLV